MTFNNNLQNIFFCFLDLNMMNNIFYLLINIFIIKYFLFNNSMYYCIYYVFILFCFIFIYFNYSFYTISIGRRIVGAGNSSSRRCKSSLLNLILLLRTSKLSQRCLIWVDFGMVIILG